MFSAERILSIRKSKGLSQELLAEQSGVSLRTIYRDRSEARRRGVAASARAKQYTWKSHGRVLAKALMAAMAGGDADKGAGVRVQSAE